MDALISIICLVVLLSVLVFVHEGGHYLVARLFGVRVTEFMLGLPGPHIGFRWKGTKFGVTAIPLGGYARVCGMENDAENPYLEQVMTYAYRHGKVNAEEVAEQLDISERDADRALQELTGWGTLAMPKRSDDGWYFAPATDEHAKGEPRPVYEPHTFYLEERKVQYRSRGFIPRVLILLAGPGMNLLFAIAAFVIIYSFIGFDLVDKATNEVTHYTVSPLRSIEAGFNYIGAVFMAIVGLFNPQTAAETVSNSTSVVGIAVLSKSAFEAGLVEFLGFTAMISVSLGLMNMLPIPPLDGGRFIVEIIQLVTRRPVSDATLGAISLVGMTAFLMFFFFMLNQDIQRFVFGNW